MTIDADQIQQPSAWVRRFAPMIPARGTVLDLACGTGRHTRLLLELGHRVVAVDRDSEAIAALAALPGVEALAADLEEGPWPYGARTFTAIVVTNYLHRPLLHRLVDALEESGLFIYETFARGNERYGRPSNPRFLLEPGELLRLAAGRMQVLAFEDLLVDEPKPAMVQRLCARRAPP